MYEVGTAALQIIPSIRGLQQSIEREVRGVNTDRAGRDAGDSYTSGFSSGAKKLGGVLAAAFAGAQIVDFGKEAIANASDMAEVGTKLSAVFGDAATDITAFGAQGAKALGQTSLQAQNAAATFGTFGKAAGLSNKENAAFSTELAKLATDMASFSNTTPEQAIEALGSGLRGEAEPLRQYGVLLDDATLRNEALSQGLITSTKEALTPANKVLAARGVIMKQTSDAQGDFERTSGGLANQQRILTAQWEDMKGKLGAAFLPAVTGTVSALNDKLFPALESLGTKATAAWDVLKTGDFAGASSAGIGEEDSPLVKSLLFAHDQAETLTPQIKAAWGVLRTGDFPGAAAGIGEEDSPLVLSLLKANDVVSKIGPGLKEAWSILAKGDFQGGLGFEEDSPLVDFLFSIRESFGGLLEQLGPIFKQVGETLGPVFVQVFDTLAPAIKELLPSLAQLLPLFNPIGLLFKALIPILPQIADLFGQIATTLASVLAEALTAIGPLIDTIVGAFQQFMPVVADLVASLLPPLLGLFKALLPILPPIAKVITQLAQVLAEGLSQALTAIAPLFQAIVGVINELVPFISQLVASLLPPLMTLFSKLAPLLSAVLGALMPVVAAIVAALIPAIEALMPVVKIVFEFIANTITNVMTVISGVIDVITGLFTGDWQKLWDGVLQIFSGIWSQIGNVISFIGDLFYEFFTNLGPKIWEIITGLASTIISWGTQFLQWIWDGITGLFPEILSWFGSLPGWVWEKFTALTSVIFDYGVQFLQWIWDGITDLFPQVLDWFGALPGKAWDMIVALTTTIIGYGGSFIGWIKDGIINGATAIWDFFTGLPGKIGDIIVGLAKDLIGLGVSLVGKIVEGVTSVAGDIWNAITEALTGGDGSNVLTGDQPGVVFGGSSSGGVITPGGRMGFAAGGVVPGVDPGRRDNVLARLPNGQAWGLRSEESVFVPEFTRAIGGEKTVHAWNRLAEQGRLGDIGLGFATGGVVGTQAAAKAYGASEAWKRAKELIQANKDNPVTGLGVAPPGARGEFMKAVASQMGLPYVWGGDSPPNFDCSGLMSWALRQAGVFDTRLTAAQFGDQFPRVNPPKPGDLAIFDTGRVSPKAGHIGMVLDPNAGTMMHTDGAGPSRVSDYTNRGGLMGFIDAIGGSYTAPGSSIGASVGSGMSNIMMDLLGKARKKLGIGLNNAVGQSGEVGTAAYNISGGVEQWRGLAMNALKAVGQYKGMDLTYAIDKMLYQMQTESGGNPNAINLWDSNATVKGTPSKGLLQTIDPTFQSALRGTPFAALIPNGPYDPWSNMIASILYGLNQYGSLDRAYRGVAYAKGGIVPGMPSWGDSVPALLTPGEGVFTAPQTQALLLHAKALEQGYSGQTPQVVINLDDSDPLQVAVAQMIEGGFAEFQRALPLAKAQA